MEVLAMLGLQAVVVLALIALVVRFDLGARALEWRIRRGTSLLLREADRVRRRRP